MKTEVKDNILDVGVGIIIKKGYHNVGIQEILNEANIPKGSFYHYFKSKEDFGSQVIQHYNKTALDTLEKYVSDESKPHKERLTAFFSEMSSFFISKEYCGGCLLGNSSIELSDTSEVFMNVVANEFDKLHTLFTKCIQEAQNNNEIKSDKPAEDIAHFILNSWEGALLRMKSSKNAKSLEIFLEFLKSYIL